MVAADRAASGQGLRWIRTVGTLLLRLLPLAVRHNGRFGHGVQGSVPSEDQLVTALHPGTRRYSLQYAAAIPARRLAHPSTWPLVCTSSTSRPRNAWRTAWTAQKRAIGETIRLVW